MKWYKRYPEFSRSPEVFHISPLSHLIYTVLCDLTAELDCEGVLAEKYVTDSAFLARRLNMRLISLEEIERLGASHDDVLLGRVTHAALLSRCVTQLCAVGLLREKRSKEGDVCVAYEIPGFTTDNQKYISDGTLRQRKHRESKDDVTNEALHSVTVTHEALLSRQEEKRTEEKRKENIQTKADALSPENLSTYEQKSQDLREKDGSEEETQKSLKTAINELQAIYNAKLGATHSRWEKTPQKRNTAATRWLKTRTVDDWSKLLDLVLQSPFLMGQTGSSWLPNSDWLLKESNYTRIEEGQFRNQGAKLNQATQVSTYNYDVEII